MVQGLLSWAFQVDTTDLCCLCDPMMMMIMIMMFTGLGMAAYNTGLSGVLAKIW